MLALMLYAIDTSSTILTVLRTVQLNVASLRLRNSRSLLILLGSSLAQFASFALGILGDAPALETTSWRNVQRLLLFGLLRRNAAKNGAERV